MPGITGIIGRRSNKEHDPAVRKMVSAMLHEAFYTSGTHTDQERGVWLGWTCIGDSFADCLPIWNERRDMCLIFSGELFNREQDIEWLMSRGHDFQTDNASYVVHLYEEIGPSFVKRLNGWFSGALFDLRGETVRIFNDRYGMNRIYFHQGEDEFIFASEAKALLKIRAPLREIEPQSVADYLRYGCVVRDKTFFKGISILPAGSCWTVRNSAVSDKHAYFEPSEWESQAPLPPDDFFERFSATVTSVIPRYATGSEPVALALTGGLDTRMIAAALQATGRSLPCCTFGGMWGELVDIRKARQIADLFGQQHDTIKLNGTFLAKFPELAPRAVYLSDGTQEAFGAHDLYLNQIARKIAPIRLTGKFGSEVVRGRRLIRWHKRYNNDFVQPSLERCLNQAEPMNGQKHSPSLSDVVFREIPWHEFGRVAIEQSQLVLRTPYLDNDLVKLMFQAPEGIRAGGQLQPRYVRQKSPALSSMLTNFGDLGADFRLLNRIRYVFFRALFKMEYIYLFAAPHWFTWLDRKLERLRPERLFSGREKFEGYRIWIKTNLSNFIRETLSDPNAYYPRLFDKSLVEQMVTRHIAGTHNYLNEINKVLTIELIHSTLTRP